MAAVSSTPWGVTTTITGITGVITDIEIANEVTTEVLRDAKGAVKRVHSYDTKYTGSCTFHAEGGTIPTAGSDFTCESRKVMATNVTLTQSNTAFQRYRISFEGYAGAKYTKEAAAVTDDKTNTKTTP